MPFIYWSHSRTPWKLMLAKQVSYTCNHSCIFQLPIVAGLVWYHALAFDLCLDTGIALVSYKHCELFFLENSLAFACIQDLDAQRRFFANMWLW
jgi:hypothetical protein